MSYNGSGTFQINTAGQPVVSGTTISSTAFNTLTADLASGLSTAITKDGQTTLTANIPWSGYRLTGLGAATAGTDAAQFKQIQSGAAIYVTAAGTDTYTGTMVPTLTAYATGNYFTFIIPNTNTTTATLNIDGLGAKAITKNGSTALAAGDLVANRVALVYYDGTRFQLLNPASSALSSSLTSAHIFVGNSSNIATDVAMSGDATLANTGAITVASIGGKAVSLANTFTTSGNFALTLTQTGATNVTLPTTGTLLNNSLTSTKFYVGNGSNVATGVAMSGDATLANTGAVTLATVNSNVGSFTNASITVNAKGLITAASSGTGGDWQFVTSTSASASATIDFTSLASGYDYMVGFSGVNLANDVDLWMRIGTGAGPTYATADYAYQNLFGLSGAATAPNISGQAQLIILDNEGTNGSNAAGFVTIFNPGSSVRKSFNYQAGGWEIGVSSAVNYGFGSWEQNTVVTAVRFLAASGNISAGLFSLYRRRNQ